MVKISLFASLFCIFVFSLFIAGCGAPADVSLPESGEKEILPETEDQTPDVQPEPEAPEVVTKAISPELSQILEKSKNVTSMYYLYYGPPQDQIAYAFYVKGKLTKVILPSRMKYDYENFYDTVYLDHEKETAFAYCEAAECVNKNKAFAVRYSEYIRPTPLDKLKLIVYGEIVGEETIDNRKVKVVEFEGVNETGRIWLSTFSGLPLKIEENINGKKVNTEYNTMVINSVADRDVIHQQS